MGVFIVSGIIVHWTIIHAAFPFGGFRNATMGQGLAGATIAAPLQQSVTIAVAPRLAVAAIFEPPLVPFLEPRVAPLQHFPVQVFLVNLPDAICPHRRLRTVWGRSGG